MTQRHGDDDLTYRNQTLRITELVTPDDPALRRCKFYDCELFGPAVLLIQGAETAISDCEFVGLDANAVLWPIPPGKTHIVGPVLALDCLFERCKFQVIGITGADDLLVKLRNG